MQHASSRARTTQGIEIAPLSGALGAEVRGLDLSRPLDAASFAAVHAAYLEHQVLVFRDQSLSPDQQLAFSRRFGELLRVPYIAPMPDHPDIIAVLKEAEERNISTFGGTWHSDFTFLEQPPSASLLYALEVPARGGDTIWADMYRAHDTLSAGLRTLLRGLRAIHSGVPYGTNGPPPDVAVSRSVRMTRGDPSADVEVAHPVVRRHGETGRAALFVNPVYTTRFADMTAEESEPLLGYLEAHATRPEFTCRVSWAPGTLVLWDNRCTQHLAVNDYDGSRRLLHRTTVVGERPLMLDEDEPA
jgi:alpha-ketoglutarate-dependent taurine dioxygenase